MDNIRFYRHPAQSAYQNKSKEPPNTILDGVGNTVDDLTRCQDMLGSGKVAYAAGSSHEYDHAQKKDMSAVMVEHEITNQPLSPSHCESADSDNNMEARKTSIPLPKATASDKSPEEKISQPSEEEPELCASRRSFDAQHRDGRESPAPIGQGAHNATSHLHSDVNSEPCRNAATLKIVTCTPTSPATPDRSCTSSTREIICTGFDHSNKTPQSGPETSTSPMRSRGHRVLGPPSSIDAPERPGLSLACHSRYHATPPSMNCARTHPEHRVTDPAIMSQTQERHAQTTDIAIFPMEGKGLWIMSAIVSELSEVQKLSDSTQAWQLPSDTLPSRKLTILSIKSLNDQGWLILAEISFPHEYGSTPPTSSQERLDRPQGIRCRRRASEHSDGSQDSAADDCSIPERATITELRRKNQHRGQSGKRRRTTLEHEYGGRSQLKRGDWQEDEDQELTRLVETETPWPAIFAMFPNRSEAAVRSRWYCTLRPLVK